MTPTSDGPATAGSGLDTPTAKPDGLDRASMDRRLDALERELRDLRSALHPPRERTVVPAKPAAAYPRSDGALWSPPRLPREAPPNRRAPLLSRLDAEALLGGRLLALPPGRRVRPPAPATAPSAHNRLTLLTAPLTESCDRTGIHVDVPLIDSQ